MRSNRDTCSEKSFSAKTGTTAESPDHSKSTNLSINILAGSLANTNTNCPRRRTYHSLQNLALLEPLAPPFFGPRRERFHARSFDALNTVTKVISIITHNLLDSPPPTLVYKPPPRGSGDRYSEVDTVRGRTPPPRQCCSYARVCECAVSRKRAASIFVYGVCFHPLLTR